MSTACIWMALVGTCRVTCWQSPNLRSCSTRWPLCGSNPVRYQNMIYSTVIDVLFRTKSGVVATFALSTNIIPRRMPSKLAMFPDSRCSGPKVKLKTLIPLERTSAQCTRHPNGRVCCPRQDIRQISLLRFRSQLINRKTTGFGAGLRY